MEYLLFQIYGVFQAWGVSGPGDYRDTYRYPSKGGLLGMVAACLGIDEFDEKAFKELFNSTGYSCRIDSPGVIITDFQIIKNQIIDTKYVPLSKPIISDRVILSDALFTICLWKNDNKLYPLIDIVEALKSPVYLPFLGRSCCMVDLPFNPKIVEKDNLTDAFNSYVVDDQNELAILKDNNPRCFWEGSDNSIQKISNNFIYDVPCCKRAMTKKRRIEFEGKLVRIGEI